MYTPANIDDNDPLMVGALSKNGIGLLDRSVSTSAPTSSGVTTNRVYYTPFYTSAGYSLARWWWQGGATLGTDYIETGIFDENFNLFRASPRTLSAGTVNQLQFANPGIHSTNLENNDNNADQTSYTTGSVTLKAGVMYTASVINSKATAANAVSSITGGPTWTSRSTTTYGASTEGRVSIWSGVPTADYTGTLVIDFGGVTQTGCGWSINAHYHVDTASQDGIVQNAVGTGNSATPLATLAAFGSANNATFGAVGNVGGNSSTVESASYLELSDNSYGTPNNGLTTYYRPDNDTTVSSTQGVSGQWGTCAVEIKSLGTGAVYVPPMRGWLAFHCSGATATFFRHSLSGAEIQNSIFLQLSATAGLPATATPSSTAGATAIPNHGFTRSTSP